MTAPSPAHSLPSRFRDPNGTPGEVFVVSHRGAFLDGGRAVLPENSVPAVENALALGVHMVEVDVHLTADGTAVVIHDNTLDRTTTATGPVADLRRADLANIELVHPATRSGYGVTPPTLEQVFAALGGRMMINVELKSGVETLRDVARIAAECGVSDLVTVKSNLKDATAFHHVRQVLDRCSCPIDFIPVLIDSRDGLAGFEAACEILKPRCIECVVDHPTGADPGYGLLAHRGLTMDGGPLFSRAARRLATAHNIRLFVNTLFVDPTIPGNHQWNGGRSCELARAAPDSVYGFWIAHGATAIQTDDAPFLLDWLRTAGLCA